ncbi:MAG TPA: hypothetical protein VJ933_01560, partial [Phaeodactylibacter sp.]|nr:hypothetical protein [Phaeodactylibacter sp.]
MQVNSQFFNLQRKVRQYEEVLENTRHYRESWKTEIREQIRSTLQKMVDETGLKASVEQRADIENLEAIVLTLGQSKSGMYQKVSDDLQR